VQCEFGSNQKNHQESSIEIYLPSAQGFDQWMAEGSDLSSLLDLASCSQFKLANYFEPLWR